MSRAALPGHSKIEGTLFARSPGLSGVAGSLGLPAPRVREKRGECTEPAPFDFDDYSTLRAAEGRRGSATRRPRRPALR
jgi:hypothetical protein